MQGDGIYLVYIHGFNSSPLSLKARQTVDWFVQQGRGDAIAVPELSHEPARAMADLCEIIANRPLPVALIGSSLGGYYATWLAERFGLRAALINPAVRPAELWQSHLGANQNFYSGRRYQITQEHVAQLRSFDVPQLTRPENLLLLVQTGDETLDYRHAVDKYKSSVSIIQPGGNHGFVNYDALLPDIIRFLSQR
jgi:predicted esterase YcpF (UPF0227 family)